MITGEQEKELKKIIENPENEYFSVDSDDLEGKIFSGQISLDSNGYINIDGILTYYAYNPLLKFGHVSGYCYLGKSFNQNLVGSPRRIGTMTYDGGLACGGKILSLKGHPDECQHMDLIWHEQFPILDLFFIKGLKYVNFSHGTTDDSGVHRQRGHDKDLDAINNLVAEFLPHGVKHMSTFVLELGLLDPKWHGNLNLSSAEK